MPKQQIKRQKTLNNKPTLYDYLKGNKNILTHDGKHHNVVLVPGISDNTFMEMGMKNFLTGEALQDYIKLVNKGEKYE